jgi:hypothetical protein
MAQNRLHRVTQLRRDAEPPAVPHLPVCLMAHIHIRLQQTQVPRVPAKLISHQVALQCCCINGK